MQKVVRFLLLIAGLSLAVYVFRQHAVTVQKSLSRVGWGFLLYFTASLPIFVFDTWGWRAVFVEKQPHVDFARLFWVQRAGEAANKVTPLASMGGEPLKIYLLTRSGAGAREAFASVAICKNVITLAQILFIFLGVAAASRLSSRPPALLLGFAAIPAAILVAIAVTAIVDLRLRRNRRRKVASGEVPEPPPARRFGYHTVVEMWGRIADYFYSHPRESAISFACCFVGWVAGALEMLAGAYVLGFPMSAAQAFAFEALIVSVNMATFLIPANAGTQEGGYAFVAPLLAISAPHALALAVLRRCRDVIWIGLGLLYLALTEGRILVRPQLEMAEGAP